VKILALVLLCTACARSATTYVPTLVVPLNPEASLIVRNECTDPRDVRRASFGNVALDFGRSGPAVQDTKSGAWLASSANYLRYYECPDGARERLAKLR
jgi:hypothetical protein